ncbi:oxygen-independent coproporphyrinogen III oxidase [Ralstonia pickettii]|nr:oxygen-independent coproporphyrinogen III oxidase [Ralstonia pickettii]
MTNIQSAYIHIPFCQQMCHYCNFVKFFYNEKLATEYLYALEQEINAYLPENRNRLSTLYIGGGTPTALNLEQLTFLFELIHKKFDVSQLDEFTIEVNPGDIDDEKAKLLKHYGVNRISFGVQVMDDQMLEQLGRVHRVKDVYQTVELFTKNNFTNISLDLIYSLPHQSVEQFQSSLEEALTFNLPHYSTYSLQIEPRTVFFQRHKKGQLHRPAEEDEVAMYKILQESMKRKGIEQYEISNFAKPTYESKHNLAYWSNDYYYGFGAGASGYIPGERITNIRPLPAYMKKALAKEKPILQIDKITLKEQIEEELFLGLRKIKGYSRKSFTKKYGFSLELLYQNQLTKLKNNGLILEEKEYLKLTNQGMLLGNRVFEEFILEENQLERMIVNEGITKVL